MEVDADVYKILELNRHFFLVPDYQREYVWKVNDHVEQFLKDIENEYDPALKETQKSYFIGSIIIVENSSKYDVIDGQQRLTTIVITLCAFRDLLEDMKLNSKQSIYFDEIKRWLSTFDMDTDSSQIRLELQYEESKDYLSGLISGKEYQDEDTASIKRMQAAYKCIYQRLENYSMQGADPLVDFARYFLTKIELVVIKSGNLSGALKIFETINQRGIGLNAMDLVKNLIFSQAKEKDFERIKKHWKEINDNLQSCNEEQSPLRFLRYFLMARYHNGILRDDEIYKWIISKEGKQSMQYEHEPMKLAKEMVKLSERYADLVNATTRKGDDGKYSAVSRLGFINKFNSRQHLIPLLALKEPCDTRLIDMLAKELESFFFFSNTMGIQAKDNERLFTQWAVSLREVGNEEQLFSVLEDTLIPHITKKFASFKQTFLSIQHRHYNPLYRVRYILGQLENTLRRLSGMDEQSLSFFDKLQIEHILPQTPKNGVLTEEFEDKENYGVYMRLLGNVTLLESTINQAVNGFNDLQGEWFMKKQSEYAKSEVKSAALLNHEYGIGKNTSLNRFKSNYGYLFETWNKKAIQDRQKILYDLAMETWLLSDKRIDERAKELPE